MNKKQEDWFWEILEWSGKHFWMSRRNSTTITLSYYGKMETVLALCSKWDKESKELFHSQPIPLTNCPPTKLENVVPCLKQSDLYSTLHTVITGGVKYHSYNRNRYLMLFSREKCEPKSQSDISGLLCITDILETLSKCHSYLWNRSYKTEKKWLSPSNPQYSVHTYTYMCKEFSLFSSHWTHTSIKFSITQLYFALFACVFFCFGGARDGIQLTTKEWIYISADTRQVLYHWTNLQTFTLSFKHLKHQPVKRSILPYNWH